MPEKTGTISMTFHGVAPAVAAQLIAAVNNGYLAPHKKTEKVEAVEPEKVEAVEPEKVEAVEPEKVAAKPKKKAKRKPKKAPVQPLPPEDEAAEDDDTGELTPAKVKKIVDRGELIRLIAEVAGADPTDVKKAFKGQRVKTLQGELIDRLENPETPAKAAGTPEIIDAELLDRPATKPPADGYYDLDDLPAELVKADRFRTLISIMVNDGIVDPDELATECKRLEGHVPVIGKTPAYARRIKVILKRL